VAILLGVFIFFGSVLSYIDYKRQMVPDKIVLPAIIILIVAKYIQNKLFLEDFVGAFIVIAIFLIPIALNMAFGGGDLRFGFFCALFVGLGGVGYFILLSALIHLLFLVLTKKQVFGFVPAMSLGAFLVYGGLNFL